MRGKSFFFFLIFISLQLVGCSSSRDILSLQSGSKETDFDCVETENSIESGADSVGESSNESSNELSRENSYESDTIFVHICGEISHPGVYEMQVGSRIYELVNRAGGLTENASASYLNQAQILQDGQQIYVPSGQEAETGTMQGAPAAVGGIGGTDSDKVNINTADQARLQTISGIGESRARDILTYRESNGPFSSIEEIMKVPGIKDGLFAKIKDRICVQ